MGQMLTNAKAIRQALTLPGETAKDFMAQYKRLSEDEREQLGQECREAIISGSV